MPQSASVEDTVIERMQNSELYWPAALALRPYEIGSTPTYPEREGYLMNESFAIGDGVGAAGKLPEESG